VLGLSFNYESTTANPAKKRRESFLPLYKFTVKTVLASKISNLSKNFFFHHHQPKLFFHVALIPISEGCAKVVPENKFFLTPCSSNTYVSKISWMYQSPFLFGLTIMAVRKSKLFQHRFAIAGVSNESTIPAGSDQTGRKF
jgi:hypothetical protein